jgi:hypothetical protein
VISRDEGWKGHYSLASQAAGLTMVLTATILFSLLRTDVVQYRCLEEGTSVFNIG